MNTSETPERSSSDEERIKLYKVGTLFLLVLSFFVAVSAVKAVKQYGYIGADIPPHRTVSVAGEGEVFAVPDTASISFSIIEEAQTTEAVQTAASERMAEALAALTVLEVPENDIRTTQYSLNPRYEHRRSACTPGESCPPEGERQLVGYELRQSVEVKLEDRELSSKVVQALGDTGVQRISDVRMTIDDPDELQAEARAQAIADAQARAEVLERDLGVKFGRVVNFRESGGDPRPIDRYEALGRGGASDQTASPSLPAGENRITSRVDITYQIK